MHLEDNLHRYFWGHKGCRRAWSCLDHFEISMSGMWKSASTVLWRVCWMPCAQATGQSLVTCELYQSCPSASLLKRFWLFQLSYLPQPPPWQGHSYKSRSLSSLMQNLGNDTCVCVQGTVWAGEGPTLRKEEELCGRSFGGQGVGELGKLQGTDEENITVFCWTGVVIWALDRHDSGHLQVGFHLPSSWSQTWAAVLLWLMNSEYRLCVPLLCRSI